MTKINLSELRPRLDLEAKYVDFNSIRTAVNILTVVESMELKITEPNKEGESRGDCPKCKKPRSFAFNINTNRFNCFNKGCGFRGGGAIDFTSKLFDLTAKEASHLIACAYGIQPYSADNGGDDHIERTAMIEQNREVNKRQPPGKDNDYVSRIEFEKMKTDFDRFRNVVYVYMLENDQTVFEQDFVETPEKTARLQ
jgi:hypothetical protein